MLDDLDLSEFADQPKAQRLVERLLNTIERLAAEVGTLKGEVQRLRDENQRLKGEQGKPLVLPNKRLRQVDHSSEQERRTTPKTWHKRAKVPEVRIDRTVELRLDRATLPPETEYKGFAEVVIQDLVIHTDNVRFRCERARVPSTGVYYQAPLPPGYVGEFGPGLKATALYLHHSANLSQPKIQELCQSVGVRVSAGYLAGLLTEQPVFAAEYEAIGQAALASSPYQHLDETPTRVSGVEHHCHILSSPLATVFRTTPTKDRLAVLDVLRLGAPRAFQLNEYTWGYLQDSVSVRAAQALRELPEGVDLDAAGWYGWLDRRLPALGPRQRQLLSDALAIGAYRAQGQVPVVEWLMVDDAPQFKGITAHLALCWVHDGRHYKKLSPVLLVHRQALEAFRNDYWAYYRDLRAYQQAPTAHERTRLLAAFATLVATKTGYADLDERIAKTAAKQAALLPALDHPFLPLHNNPAELGARQRVRKRDVSFGARSPAGITAWDVMQTIVATATTLGVNVLHYLQDRLSGAPQLPALADLIRQRAALPTAAPHRIAA